MLVVVKTLMRMGVVLKERWTMRWRLGEGRKIRIEGKCDSGIINKAKWHGTMIGFRQSGLMSVMLVVVATLDRRCDMVEDCFEFVEGISNGNVLKELSLQDKKQLLKM
ncbi:hypothetical protein BY996DRAFT_6490046 [Phakopsora pachyrhizi]|uniref:Uncharacterized protein n=1 Tax=Phakopsora pachyrhizi TaxID=170000 RepID=A0AAV0AV25_PHAPC|nr:hypothetical protein BY996DRAFT_6609218 [Phakopsora pachyrhizi]KAI8459542.1 hypothetical protein BY996DRAFT_6490046 [Phakopsora pachyrhizi]CAH7671889.1 hypothetical protein PPACK8108_LOCUS6727 [Phakopsora pachyrhizi]